MDLDRPLGIGRTRYDADRDCTVCRCDSCLQWWPLDTDFWKAQPAYKSKRYPSRKCRACEAERRLAAFDRDEHDLRQIRESWGTGLPSWVAA